MSYSKVVCHASQVVADKAKVALGEQNMPLLNPFVVFVKLKKVSIIALVLCLWTLTNLFLIHN